MNLDEIRELVRLMVESNLSEIDIVSGENKYRLRRGPTGEPVLAPMMAAPAMIAPAAAPTAAPAAAAPAPAESLIEIRSPMVGTFYAAASPDSDPFVRVGANVSEDSVICIVEAMKVMNEIKAECAGRIAEVCVKNAQPVEYGQVLFRVSPL